MSPHAPPCPVRLVEHVMGMPISLALRGRHAAGEHGRAAWARALAVLREVDRVFSTFRPDSCICRLDRGEITLADCPPEVAEVMSLGDLAEEQSGGAFRITRGGVLDPSGVVKGWAVERAAAHLRALAGTDFCLAAGGDLVCRTLDAAAPPWRIGIEDPHDPGRIVAVVPVRTGAVATSGTAHRGTHIVDGRTGLPPAGVASVTVVATSLTWADIDATAAYARGLDAAAWLGTRRDRTGLVVWSDGTTTLVGEGSAGRRLGADRAAKDPRDTPWPGIDHGPSLAGRAAGSRTGRDPESARGRRPRGGEY